MNAEKEKHEGDDLDSAEAEEQIDAKVFEASKRAGVPEEFTRLWIASGKSRFHPLNVELRNHPAVIERFSNLEQEVIEACEELGIPKKDTLIFLRSKPKPPRAKK